MRSPTTKPPCDTTTSDAIAPLLARSPRYVKVEEVEPALRLVDLVGVDVRRSPGKRPFEEANPEGWPALEKLVDPLTRGAPGSPLRWICKSTHALSAELFSGHGIRHFP